MLTDYNPTSHSPSNSHFYVVHPKGGGGEWAPGDKQKAEKQELGAARPKSIE
jgi:hypothetical protein